MNGTSEAASAGSSVLVDSPPCMPARSTPPLTGPPAHAPPWPAAPPASAADTPSAAARPTNSRRLILPLAARDHRSDASVHSTCRSPCLAHCRAFFLTCRINKTRFSLRTKAFFAPGRTSSDKAPRHLVVPVALETSPHRPPRRSAAPSSADAWPSRSSPPRPASCTAPVAARQPLLPDMHGPRRQRIVRADLPPLASSSRRVHKPVVQVFDVAQIVLDHQRMRSRRSGRSRSGARPCPAAGPGASRAARLLGGGGVHSAPLPCMHRQIQAARRAASASPASGEGQTNGQ